MKPVFIRVLLCNLKTHFWHRNNVVIWKENDLFFECYLINYGVWYVSIFTRSMFVLLFHHRNIGSVHNWCHDWFHRSCRYGLHCFFIFWWGVSLESASRGHCLCRKLTHMYSFLLIPLAGWNRTFWGGILNKIVTNSTMMR